MGVQIPVGFAQMYLRWRLSGDPQDQVVTIGVNGPAGVPVAQWPNVMAGNLTARALTTAAGMQQGWTWLGLAMDYQTATGIIRYEDPVAVVGTNAGTGLPSNCALLVSKITALGGRKYRGRNFWPAAYLYESSVDQRGVIAPASLAALQTSMSGFLTDCAADDMELVLLHSGPEVPTPIVGLVVDDMISTQRRRMR